MCGIWQASKQTHRRRSTSKRGRKRWGEAGQEEEDGWAGEEEAEKEGREGGREGGRERRGGEGGRGGGGARGDWEGDRDGPAGRGRQTCWGSVPPLQPAGKHAQPCVKQLAGGRLCIHVGNVNDKNTMFVMTMATCA